MSSDETAFLFYLLLLLAFIGGGLLYRSREKLSTTVQQAAIWGLIFVGVIIAYGFSDTLQRQLMPSRGFQTGVDEYAIQRAGDGHYYLTLDINGTDVLFVVDTGASAIVLTKQDAKRVGLAPDTLNYSGRANTANGTVRTAPVILDDIRLGDITDRNLRAAVNEGRMEDSLLGMTYLNRFSEIAIRGDQMILRR